MADPGQGAPLVPIAPVRWAERQRWRWSSGGTLPLPIFWSVARDLLPLRRRVAGRVWLPAQHAETPVLWRWSAAVGRRPWRAGKASLPPVHLPETPVLWRWKPTVGRRPWRAGRAVVPPVHLPEAAVVRPYSVLRVVGHRILRRGRMRIGGLLAPPPPAIPFAFPTKLARDPQPRRRRVGGFVWFKWRAQALYVPPLALLTEARYALQVPVTAADPTAVLTDGGGATQVAVLIGVPSAILSDADSATQFEVYVSDPAALLTDSTSALQLAV
jgi:hypothetical protein